MGYQDFCPLCGKGFHTKIDWFYDYTCDPEKKTSIKKYGLKNCEKMRKTIESLEKNNGLYWIEDIVGLQSGKPVKHYKHGSWADMANYDSVIRPSQWHTYPLKDYPRFILVLHKSCWEIVDPIAKKMFKDKYLDDDYKDMFQAKMVRYLMTLKDYIRMPPNAVLKGYQEQDPVMFKDNLSLTIPKWHFEDPKKSKKQKVLIKKTMENMENYFRKNNS